MNFHRALPLALPAMLLAACEAPEATDVSQADVEAQDVPGGTGISQEALETNRVLSVLGQYAREIENAPDPEQAAESLREFVGTFEAGRAELPAGLVSQLQDHVVIAQEAVDGNDLEGARMAAQSMIEEMRAAAPAGGPV